ncbi:hypothetical protein [Jatrophihabitans sp.]|uniref:hypothetical protein n=1 Tax=Jatrophihabitans sp. TaxID=1932789 RepID=UPI002C40436A|nr:hypothetical protein [Jatrophihabitans sp.]
MTEQSRPEDRPSAEDPTERPGGADDLGGPGAALGSGVENALTGEQPGEDDEGKASTSPEPKG